MLKTGLEKIVDVQKCKRCLALRAGTHGGFLQPEYMLNSFNFYVLYFRRNLKFLVVEMSATPLNSITGGAYSRRILLAGKASQAKTCI